MVANINIERLMQFLGTRRNIQQWNEEFVIQERQSIEDFSNLAIRKGWRNIIESQQILFTLLESFQTLPAILNNQIAIKRMYDTPFTSRGLTWTISSEILTFINPNINSIYRGKATCNSFRILFGVEIVDLARQAFDKEHPDPPENHFVALEFFDATLQLLNNEDVGINNADFLMVDIFLSWVDRTL